jgi:hypothetical protein
MFRIIDIPEPLDRRKMLARIEGKARWKPGTAPDFAMGGRIDRLDGLLRRVERFAARNDPLQHLKKEDRDRLYPIAAGVALRGPTTAHRIDEIAATLYAEAPWLAVLIEAIWIDMQQAYAEGREGLWFRPTLANGPAGIGKSRLMRRLAALCGDVPVVEIDVGSASAAFRIAGAEKGWSSATPGRPVETILQHRVGNPVVIVDEICKAAEMRDTRGMSTSIVNALLPLLEPATAARWECPYFRLPFDMRRVNWLLTSNDLDRVPAVLKSRCRVIALPRMTLKDLEGFTRAEIARRGLDEAVIDLVMLNLAVLEPDDPRLNARTVIRMLDRCAQVARRPMLN